MVVYNSEEGPRTQSHCYSDLGLSAFKSVTIIFLFSKPPGLWYFVWWLEHSNTYKLFRWALNTITGILQEGAEGDFRLREGDMKTEEKEI